jgi:hypothetical protein
MDSSYRIFLTRLFIFPKPFSSEPIFYQAIADNRSNFFKERSGKILIHGYFPSIP